MLGEVLEGSERRRRWSKDDKTTILAELAKPRMRTPHGSGVNGTLMLSRVRVEGHFGTDPPAGFAADPARGTCGLLYTWRKERRAAAAATTTEIPIARVLLTGPAQAPAAATIAESQFIEIEVKGAWVRLPGNAPESTVAYAIKTLRGRS